jgi:hypothetical protein
MKRIKDKNIPRGNELLFKRGEWIPYNLMDMEIKVLDLPVLHEGFKRVIKRHTSTQPTAFVSLCTATRPYYLSKKWKTFKEEFGHKVDMITISNAGFFPEPFWEAWPALNYGPIKGPPYPVDEIDDEKYHRIMLDRMIRFFKNNEYKYVIVNFHPKQRSYKLGVESMSTLKNEGIIEDYSIIPTIELYEKAKEDGFHGSPNSAGDMFPDLHKFILNVIIQQVEDFGYDESKFPKTVFDL